MSTHLDAPWSDLTAALERWAASWSDPVREDELPPCPRCGGSGELHHLERSPDPQTRVDYPCPRCGGDGVIEDTETPAGQAPSPAGGPVAAPAARPSASSPLPGAPPPAGITPDMDRPPRSPGKAVAAARSEGS